MDQPQLYAQQGPKSVLQRFLRADYLCSYFSGLEHLELQLRGNELRSVVSLLIIRLYFFNIHDNSDLTKLGDMMIADLIEKKLLDLGEKVVITVGDGKFFRQGTTNSIRVEIIKDVPKALKNLDQDSIQEVSFDKGKLLLDTSICASCQACINVCPYEIWTTKLEKNHDTRIDASKVHMCDFDMQCVEACPTGAIEIIPYNQ